MITEQELENYGISWFQELGWQHAQGSNIAPDGENSARTDYRQSVLHERLLAAPLPTTVRPL